MTIPLPQIALLAGALVAGVLLDRLFITSGSNASDSASTAAASQQSVPAIATAPLSSTPVPVREQRRPTAENAAADKLSLDRILAEHDPRQRNNDLQTYINSLKPGEYAEALKRVRQMTSTNERELASRLLVAQWVATDPASALQFAAANRGYEYLADDVFQQRAATDLQSALTQAQEIPGNDLRYRALRGVLSFQADTDPIGALKLAETLGPFPGNEPLSNILYRQWAATDPTTAASYAAQQADGQGWRSPISQVMSTWAQQDPVAAANWSLSLSDAQAQARSLSQVMRDWGRDDPTSTANWIHSLPTGGSRDSAVAGFAQSMAFADPQNALNWIGTITSDQIRQQTLQRISGAVMYRDPQNGAAMLQSAGLPADQIRQPPPRRGGP